MVLGSDYEFNDAFIDYFNSLQIRRDEPDPRQLQIEPVPFLNRPGIGKNGETIELLVNWFQLITKNKPTIYIYNVNVLEEKKPRPTRGRGRGGGRGGNRPPPRPTVMTNKENAQIAFWNMIRKHGESFTISVRDQCPCLENFVFDGHILYLPYKIPGKYTYYVDHPDEQIRLHTNVIIEIEYVGRFDLDPSSKQSDIASFSQMFGKALAIQSVRIPPYSAAEKAYSDMWHFSGRHVFEIPRNITPRCERDLEMKVLPGIRAWLGFTTALRTGDSNQLFLNLGLVNSLFYRMDISLIDFYIEVEMEFGQHVDTSTEAFQNALKNMTMNRFQRAKLEKYAKDLRVKSMEAYCCDDVKPKGPKGKPTEKVIYLTERHFKIIGVGNQSASTFLTEAINPATRQQLSLEEFYWRKGRPLKYPNLPVILVKSGTKESAQPMEVLFVHDSPQRYSKILDYVDARKFIQKVARSPTEYKRQTDRLIRAMDFKTHSKYFTSFGMQLHLDMTKCQGRVLEEPSIRDTEGKNHILQPDRSYQIKEVSETVDEIILDFCITLDPRTNNECIDNREAALFYYALLGRMRDRGMNVNIEREPQVYRAQLVPDLSNPSLYEPSIDEVDFHPDYKSRNGVPTFPAMARDARRRFRETYPADTTKKQIIVIAVVRGNDFYGRIKYLLDSYICVPCQCVDRDTIAKALLDAESNRHSIPYNLALKINGKLGGANMRVEVPSYLHGGDDDLKVSSVMYVGIDVTHPGVIPGRDSWDDSMNISLACIVGSIDFEATRYKKRSLAQMRVRETVERFDTQFTHLMMDFYDRNKQYPKHIVIYRDGVSDSEMRQTCAIELKWIRESWDKAIKEQDLTPPTFTYIVVQKRHKTRFIRPVGEEKFENSPSGTVVDQLVVSPKIFDFWLTAQHGAIGTSRPIHYTVVFDEWKLSPDQIYEMTYRLCFLNARCRKPCALPAPVLYAHLACAQDKEKYRDYIKYKPNASQADIENALNVGSSYPGMPFV